MVYSPVEKVFIKKQKLKDFFCIFADESMESSIRIVPSHLESQRWLGSPGRWSAFAPTQPIQN